MMRKAAAHRKIVKQGCRNHDSWHAEQQQNNSSWDANTSGTGHRHLLNSLNLIVRTAGDESTRMGSTGAHVSDTYFTHIWAAWPRYRQNMQIFLGQPAPVFTCAPRSNSWAECITFANEYLYQQSHTPFSANLNSNALLQCIYA